MIKYNVQAIRTDEYIVEIDETVWTPEALESWSSVFTDIENTEELAEHITFLLMRFGYERFIEGFGYIQTQNSDGYQYSQFERDDKGNMVTVTEFSAGIKVTIISEDDEYSFETEEIKSE